MMNQILHSCALRIFSMLCLLLLPLASVVAQSYPSTSYTLDKTGKVLVKWKGSETTINMQADPTLSKVTAIGESAFARHKSLASISLPDGLTSVGKSAFAFCKSLVSITLPDGLTSMGERVFFACSSLVSISLPKSLTVMGERAFFSCSSLVSIKIPERVTSIGEATFFSCSSLVSISLPDGLTSMGESAFANCLSLTSLRIPKTVEEIGSEIIQGSGVQTVFCYLDQPLGGVDSQTFIKDPQADRLYVLPGKLNAYVSAGWNDYFKEIVEMDASDAKYRISLEVQGEGTIAITGFDDLTKVPHGTELTLVPNPKEGWELSKLTANGTDIIEKKTFVVKEATTVVAIFTKQTHTITMRTAKKIGDKINLYILAGSNVNIDGATGTFENGKRVGFTLTKQVVTITGRVEVLHCDVNQITALDVSKNAVLTELACFSNQLTSLDVSKNTTLTKLFCERNQLANLDLSKNTALVDVYCPANQIRGEAMTNLVKSLRSLPTGRKGEICIIDTKYAQEGNVCTKADVAIAKGKGWRVTDLNGKWVDRKDYEGSDGEEVAGQEIITMTTDKEIGDKIKLYIKAEGDVNIDGATGTFVNGKLVVYTLTKQTVIIKGKVTTLHCDANQLSSLNVSSSTALTWLDCYNNRLEKLDVSKNKALALLSCAENRLTSLDVSENTALTLLHCSSNRLKSIDVSNNTVLKRLSCTANQLTELDVSKNKALIMLSCIANPLTSIDVSKNVALREFSCDQNRLTTLDVSNNTTLTTLSCATNQLTNLDVSRNTALTDLYCSENNLTSLDISHNTALKRFVCGSNQLAELNVSKNPALITLSCATNQLKSLDLLKNPALTTLNCHTNRIKDEAMTNLVKSLRSLPTSEKGEICIIDTKNTNEGNVCTKAEVAIAKDRGWKVIDANGSDKPIEYEGSDDISVIAVDHSNIEVYPNPATDFVQIKGANASTIVRLYNLDGRLVLIAKTDADGIRLDVSTLAMGEYLLTVGSSYSQRISIVR